MAHGSWLRLCRLRTLRLGCLRLARALAHRLCTPALDATRPATQRSAWRASSILFASASSVLSSPRSVSVLFTLSHSFPCLSLLRIYLLRLPNTRFIFLCCLFTPLIQPRLPPVPLCPPSADDTTFVDPSPLSAPHPHITFSDLINTQHRILASISTTRASHPSTAPNQPSERAHQHPHTSGSSPPPPHLFEPLILATNFRHGS